MNYGILHNRRPVKAEAAGDGRSPLLNDPRMREMAKQMGLEPKDFGKEAMELWKTLDAMAQNDPTAYQNFISDQLKDGPPRTETETNPDDEAATSPPVQAFNPTPGYVVKCTMMGAVKQQMTELKLFLNLCFHAIIDLPRNPHSGRDVPRDTHSVPTTSNLQIPLVIGTLREIKDFSGTPCRAIDVVFHPWVHDRCEWDAKFKRDILSLAISWVQQDAKITLTSSVGKFIKSTYKGGVAFGTEIITARFPIEPEQQQTRTLDVKFHEDKNDHEDNTNVGLPAARPSSQTPVEKIAMASPSDLLKKMTLGEVDDHGSDFLIGPAGQKDTKQFKGSVEKAIAQEEKEKPKTKLIEVIEQSGTKQEVARTPKATKKDLAVKRGFLNATKKPLYPSGSSEGRPASAYVNLLSRSKVVDLSAQEKQKSVHQEEMQRQREEIASLIGMKTPNAKASTPTNSKTSGEEHDHGDREFEQLCMEADPELAPFNARAIDPASTTQGIFGEHLDAFTNFLSTQS